MHSATRNLKHPPSYTGKNNSLSEISDDNVTMPEQLKILIVDDRPQNLIALTAVLASANYTLVTASSGEEALRYLLREDFAVILLDVQMPDLDGFETARLIKARQKSKHIPIVFITAASQASEHVQKGFEVGAVDYIFKPFSPDTLRLKVEALVKMSVNHQYVRHLVEARTAQLKSINQKLRDEIAERQKLAESFHALFDVSPCLMAIRSLDDGRFIEVNQSWLNYTGFEYQEVIGQTDDVINITFSYENERVYPEFATLSRRCSNIRVNYTTKTGEKRDGILSTELAELDRRRYLLLVITDISQQIKLEREVTRLERFHLIGEMAAGIAHEIRNPMTSIRGFLQLSKEKGRLSPEHIDLMLDELDRANRIITEFLTLAKDKRVERRSVCINEIIDALYPLIQAEAFMKSKTIKLALSECPLLELDDKEIRQLILNLAVNGLEAMDKGGVLEISTIAEDGYVILAVKDSGYGIDEELLDKICVPFFTTKDCGTGLGLPICYSIAARHDAIMDIDTSGNGTTFSVRFPCESKLDKLYEGKRT